MKSDGPCGGLLLLFAGFSALGVIFWTLNEVLQCFYLTPHVLPVFLHLSTHKLIALAKEKMSVMEMEMERQETGMVRLSSVM